MTKQEVALQVFLRRMPPDHLNDKTQAGYESAAKEAAAVAEIFLAECPSPTFTFHNTWPAEDK